MTTWVRTIGLTAAFLSLLSLSGCLEVIYYDNTELDAARRDGGDLGCVFMVNCSCHAGESFRPRPDRLEDFSPDNS